MSDRSLTNEMVSIPSRKDHLSKFNERRPAGYPSDKEIPVVLVLKRKAIRVYPDNQKVVLYYSQALDKYVSIPFGPKSDVLGSPLNESRKPKKEKDDKDSTTKALEKYPNIAAHYRKAKEEQPERRGLRRVVRKLTPKEIMNLPPEERKVAYKMAQQMASSSDMPLSHKLGVKAGLATLNFMAKRKDRKIKSKASTPKKSSSTSSAKGADVMPPSMGKTSVSTRPSVAESYRQKVGVLREENLDEALPLAAMGARVVGAGIGAAVRAGSAAWKARKAAQAAKKAAKAAKGGKKLTARQRMRLAKRKHGGKLAAGAAAAATGALGAMQAAGATTSAEKEAQQNYQFTLQTKVGDPRSQQIVRGGSETDQQKRSWGIKENVSTSNLTKIKYIVENNINSYDMTFEGSDNSININNRVAKKVLHVYETLNTTNKNKFSKMLNENATTFKQAINFVIRH
jgi:hypothetical protein